MVEPTTIIVNKAIAARVHSDYRKMCDVDFYRQNVCDPNDLNELYTLASNSVDQSVLAIAFKNRSIIILRSFT